MSVTDKHIASLKPKTKRYMESCDDNLYIEVFPDGKKVWRYRQYMNGKNYSVTLDTYPALSLKDARDSVAKLRLDIKDNKYIPVAQRKSFAEVFDMFYADKVEPDINKGEKTRYKVRLYGSYLISAFGEKAITSIKSADILKVIQDIEKQGKGDLAHRVMQTASQIFRYAGFMELRKDDPTYALQGALIPKKTTHYPCFTNPKDVAQFVAAIRNKPQSPVARLWLELHLLTFVRPSELRKATWSEVDFEEKMWTIPAERMKEREEHKVPLCRRAIELLERLHSMTGHSQYLFPGQLDYTKPMSENAESLILRRMGIRADQMCPHGFRGMASTLLHEAGYRHEVIEKQLSHAIGNKVSQSYNRADYLPERIKLMEDYSKLIDRLIEKYTK